MGVFGNTFGETLVVNSTTVVPVTTTTTTTTAPATTTTAAPATTTTAAPAYELKMVFDSKENADLLVGNSASVGDWNTFFDTANKADTPFNDISQSGTTPCTIILYGATNLVVVDGYDNGLGQGIHFGGSTSLIEIIDTGCVVGVGYMSFYACDILTTCILPSCLTIGIDAFQECPLLTNINFSSVVTISDNAFSYCESLVTVDLPSMVSIGDNCFSRFPVGKGQGIYPISTINIPVCTSLGQSTGENYVFANIVGSTITLTIPHALETDGDVVYLVANNIVTIVYSD